MTWMLTATGASLDLRAPDHASIGLLDIAHHLAQINRFCGACSRPYSVAEHSLLVCDILEREARVTDPSILQAALMHDAHEAYTQDLSSPMKQLVGTAWAVEELRIQATVLARFGLITSFSAARDLITWADLTALVTEKEALLPPTRRWPAELHHQPVHWADLQGRNGMTWLDWRQAFIDKFSELQYARAEVLALRGEPGVDEPQGVQA